MNPASNLQQTARRHGERIVLRLVDETPTYHCRQVVAGLRLEILVG
jgi:hypothetical protein